MSELLKKIKYDLTVAMKDEISLKKAGMDDELEQDATGCIAQKEASRAIISMFPELGIKPNDATDDDTLKLLKKFIANEKERELYQQKFVTKEDIEGLTSSELKKFIGSKITELGDKLTSGKIEAAAKYLPKQSSEEEIYEWIKANVDFSKYKNKMQAMGLIMKQFSGNDGNFVKEILLKF
jgi:uncharacterized protein YqeY